MKITTQAPLRISLFGGGTDVGEYAKKYGGACINMAINIHQKFTISDEGKDKLIKDDSVDFIRAFVGKGLSVQHELNGFIHGGLGSSASAAVALISGTLRLNGKKIDKRSIAEMAWKIEVNNLKLFGGKQDQYCASFGGFNLMRFGRGVAVEPLSAGDITDYILLFDTGFRRKKREIQEGLEEITMLQKLSLDGMYESTLIAENLINHRMYRELGRLMDENWEYKKASNTVSTPEIDKIYSRAKKLGAWGGKLCGSGGGGYMIFMLRPDEQGEFIKNIGIKNVDYGGIDYTGVFSKII